MKSTLLKLVLLGSAAALVGSAFSATVISVDSGTFGEPGLTDGGVIVDPAGAALAAGAGFWALGTYSGPAFSPGLHVASVTSNFTVTGSIQPTAGEWGFINQSVFDADPGNTLQGQQVYVLIGISPDILTSTQIAVYTSGSLFPTQDALGNVLGDSVHIRTDAGLVFGAVVDGVDISAPFEAANGVGQVSLVSGQGFVIPEPSSSLFLGLGSLGLLIRRRVRTR